MNPTLNAADDDSHAGGRSLFAFAKHVSGAAVSMMQRAWWLFAAGLLRVVAPVVGVLHRRPMWVFVTLIALVLVLGSTGFYQHLQSRGEDPTVSDVIYLSLQLFLMESGGLTDIAGWRLQTARYLGALVMVAAVSRALFTFFYEQCQLFVLRLFGQDHVIICGLGRKGERLVEELLTKRKGKNREWVVVVESKRENEALDRCRELGATILVGSSTDRLDIGKAHVHRAKALVSVAGTDGTNVETAVLARKLNARRREGMLRCIIHVPDRKLRQLLIETEMATKSADRFEFEYFDVFEICARAMLHEALAFKHASMLKNDNHRIVSVREHLLIVGFGRLGETLVLRAINDWKIDSPKTLNKLQITVIGKDAERAEREFRKYYPELFTECVLKFRTLEIHQPEFEKGAALFDSDGKVDVTAVYVCIGDDSLGVCAAMTLSRLLEGRRIPIILRLSEEAGLVTALRKEGDEQHHVEQIRSIGLLEISCNSELAINGAHELLARALHQGYVQRRLQQGDTIETNKSLVSWEKLPEDKRESNRDRARAVSSQLETIGYKKVPVAAHLPRLIELTPAEISTLAELEHERWVVDKTKWFQQKKKTFFRSSSANVNADVRYLKPWDKLSADEKKYNCDEMAELPKILAKTNFEIRPVDLQSPPAPQPAAGDLGQAQSGPLD